LASARIFWHLVHRFLYSCSRRENSVHIFFCVSNEHKSRFDRVKKVELDHGRQKSIHMVVFVFFTRIVGLEMHLAWECLPITLRDHIDAAQQARQSGVCCPTVLEEM